MRNPVDMFMPLLLLALLLETPLAKAETCEETLKLVQQLYNTTVDDCAGNPASNCSGLTIRATTRAAPPADQTTHIWNPGTIGQRLGTSAFSYMRKDITYPKPGRSTENGYIKAPIDYLCQNQAPVDIQCAFPKDGWTDYRTEQGCGDNIGAAGIANTIGTAPVEKACQDMGIHTGSQWLAHFRQFAGQSMPDQFQCGFGMASQRSKEDRTAAFKGFLDARKLITGSAFPVITEVRIANPAPDQMPILAFFRTSLGGGDQALKNQRDYLAKTGNYRPIITIDFPKRIGDVARFSCASQQTPIPPEMNSTPGFCRPGTPPSQGFGQCPPYIKSVRWVERRDFGEFGNTPTWSLEVTPNECARGPLTKAQADRMKGELWEKANAADKAVTDREWASKNKGPIMNLQLDCLRADHASKPTWNIEPRRQETDPARYQATGCNPPDPQR